MQEEGDTVTTVIESQGDVEEVTQTTVTVEHKASGDVLDGDTGIVTSRYEGDADQDWGGDGTIYSHASCTDAASGFPATGTDGRTVACGHAKNNSLTTWRQYVDLNSFDIEDGGQVDWQFYFAFPNSMYTNSSRTAFVETKGYYNNVLQWETGQITIDKNDFTQNPYNYSNNTNWVNTVIGSQDFAGQLDKVYINIGGYGPYYWDEFQYNVAYNYITTVVETWMQVVEQQQNLDTTLDLMDNYEIMDTFEQDVVDTTMEDMVNMDIPDIEMDTGGDVMTDTTAPVTEMFEDLELDMPMVDMEEIVAEVEEIVAEIQETDTTDIEPEVENTTENAETEEISPSINGAGEPEEKVDVEKVAEETEISEPETEEAKAEEKMAKQQETKQEKAKEIIENFASNYDPVAQITTLALVNALGPNINTYSNQIIVKIAPQWYETEEIYMDVVMEDPLGNYFSVRDSLVFEQMIGQQYE
tara:strand:+ start:774 stop:2186 length:1413 start_codon:yes stop_codon:yes gene_type:complete